MKGMNTTLAVVFAVIVILITALEVITIFSHTTPYQVVNRTACSIMSPSYQCYTNIYEPTAVYNSSLVLGYPSNLSSNFKANIEAYFNETFDVAMFKNSMARNMTTEGMKRFCDIGRLSEEGKTTDFGNVSLNMSCYYYSDPDSFYYELTNASERFDYIKVVVSKVGCVNYIQTWVNKTGECV